MLATPTRYKQTEILNKYTNLNWTLLSVSIESCEMYVSFYWNILSASAVSQLYHWYSLLGSHRNMNNKEWNWWNIQFTTLKHFVFAIPIHQLQALYEVSFHLSLIIQICILQSWVSCPGAECNEHAKNIASVHIQLRLLWVTFLTLMFVQAMNRRCCNSILFLMCIWHLQTFSLRKVEASRFDDFLS